MFKRKSLTSCEVQACGAELGGSRLWGETQGAWAPSLVSSHTPAAAPWSDRSASAEPCQPGPRSPATGRRQSPPVPLRTRGHGLGQAAQDRLGQVRATLQLVDLAGSECAGECGEPAPGWPGLGVLTVSRRGLQGWRPPPCPLSLAPPSRCRLSTEAQSVSSHAAPQAPDREGSPAAPGLSLPGPQVIMGGRPVTGSPPRSPAECSLPILPLFCFSDAS